MLLAGRRLRPLLVRIARDGVAEGGERHGCCGCWSCCCWLVLALVAVRTACVSVDGWGDDWMDGLDATKPRPLLLPVNRTPPAVCDEKGEIEEG